MAEKLEELGHLASEVLRCKGGSQATEISGRIRAVQKPVISLKAIVDFRS